MPNPFIIPWSSWAGRHFGRVADRRRRCHIETRSSPGSSPGEAGSQRLLFLLRQKAAPEQPASRAAISATIAAAWGGVDLFASDQIHSGGKQLGRYPQWRIENGACNQPVSVGEQPDNRSSANDAGKPLRQGGQNRRERIHATIAAARSSDNPTAWARENLSPASQFH